MSNPGPVLTESELLKIKDDVLKIDLIIKYNNLNIVEEMIIRPETICPVYSDWKNVFKCFCDEHLTHYKHEAYCQAYKLDLLEGFVKHLMEKIVTKKITFQHFNECKYKYYMYRCSLILDNVFSVKTPTKFIEKIIKIPPSNKEWKANYWLNLYLYVMDCFTITRPDLSVTNQNLVIKKHIGHQIATIVFDTGITEEKWTTLNEPFKHIDESALTVKDAESILLIMTMFKIEVRGSM